MNPLENWGVKISNISEKESVGLEQLVLQDTSKGNKRRNKIMEKIIEGKHLKDPSHVIVPPYQKFVQLAQHSRKVLFKAAHTFDPQMDLIFETPEIRLKSRFYSN